MNFDSEKVLRGLARFQRDPSKKASKKKRKETATADAEIHPPPPPLKKKPKHPVAVLPQTSATATADFPPSHPRPEVHTELPEVDENIFGPAGGAEFPPMGRIFVPEWNLKEDESITSNPASAMRFVPNAIPPTDRREIRELPSDSLQSQIAVAVSRVLCLGWEGSSRMIEYERECDELKAELIQAKEAREEMTRKLVEKDGDISRLRSESEEKSLLIAGNRRMMSQTKCELEGIRKESLKKGDEVVRLREQIKALEAKYKALEDKSDLANALAFNFGYGKLKSELLENNPELDLSSYNPPEVVENAEEEEEDEEEEEGGAEEADVDVVGDQRDHRAVSGPAAEHNLDEGGEGGGDP